MSAELKASRQDTTLILTISNPGARNALHPEVFSAAIEALSTAERDDTVGAVILTGADKFFCAGGDLHHLLESRSGDKAHLADSIDSFHGWIEAIRDCPKPVIAAVDGAAAGAGFSLALACDFIVAGSSAQFSMAYAKVALTPDGGGSWFLAQSLPRQLATEILIEGKSVLAPRLHQLGIVNRVVADGSALDAALVWADELAALPHRTVGRVKSLLQQAQSNSLTQHFEEEKHNLIECLHHPDAYEGITAFLEKRNPKFK